MVLPGDSSGSPKAPNTPRALRKESLQIGFDLFHDRLLSKEMLFKFMIPTLLFETELLNNIGNAKVKGRYVLAKALLHEALQTFVRFNALCKGFCPECLVEANPVKLMNCSDQFIQKRSVEIARLRPLLCSK